VCLSQIGQDCPGGAKPSRIAPMKAFYRRSDQSGCTPDCPSLLFIPCNKVCNADG
jgi:hypothetical protein